MSLKLRDPLNKTYMVNAKMLGHGIALVVFVWRTEPPEICQGLVGSHCSRKYADVQRVGWCVTPTGAPWEGV